MNDTARGTKPHVVVVGGGFGGIKVVRALASAPVDVTLIDRRNHHLFQPLLYEVATAALSPGQIAVPLRRIFRGQSNVRIVMGEAGAVDLDARTISLDGADDLEREEVAFDYLVLATGSTHHYFGKDEWEAHAPGLKSVEDALTIRRRFLLAFEKAERSADPTERERLMTVVIVGAGPTGIELAGTMSEVARHVLRGEFRRLDPSSFRIVLVEGADRLLPSMDPKLSARAKRDLEELGVEVRLDTRVTGIADEEVELASGDPIATEMVVWAAGVRGAPIERGLDSSLTDDRRLRVEPDLSLAGRPRVFAIGDLARVEIKDREVPGLAPAAMQMGAFVGDLIDRETRGKIDPASRPSFRYRDKGTLATIGRGKAVADLGGAQFGGLVAWLLWVFIHIFFLVGFRNRLLVLVDWAYAYVSFQRGSRLITGERSEGEANGGGSRR